LFQASSAEVFGNAADQPQDEHTPHDPLSPYGSAKSRAHRATADYRDSRGLFACNGILFGHESPLRPTTFVVRKIARGAAEIAVGARRHLELGNLEVRRDWGAAQEYVVAMWLMLQRPEPTDFVIASGATSSLRDVVEIAFAAAGVDDVWDHVGSDPTLMRPAEVLQTWGSPVLAQRELGWRASIALPELVSAMVDVDAARLRGGVEESPSLLGWED
jgi:GDPmannose 4,6-dehydratase